MKLRPLSLAIALVVVLPNVAGAQQRMQPKASDSNWAPPVFSLGTASDVGNVQSGGPRAIGQTQDTQTFCTPVVKKIAEGTCSAGARTVVYSNGCGSQSQAQEACASGKWEWWYLVTGLGGGGTSTSSIIKAACIQEGTTTRLDDSACGAKPTDSPSPCLIGQSYQTQLPACADFVGPQIKYPSNINNFWRPDEIRNY